MNNMEYDDEDNLFENVDDEDEEMVNENVKEGASNVGSKLDGKEKLAPPNIQIKPPGTKQKRRSKNDCNGRDYVCGCGKTYLSYPALYTHIKTKHNGKTPEGTNANQVQSGRGRGRPRKNFLINEEALIRRNRDSFRNEASLEERHPEIKDLYYKKDTKGDYESEMDEIYMKIYRAFGLLNDDEENGGTMHSLDPEEGFPNPKSMKTETNQMGYEVLYNKVKFLFKNGLGSKTIRDKGSSNGNGNHIALEADYKITCDDAFALFFIDMSRYVKLNFYKMIIILIKNYRDCMNKLGWELLSQFKNIVDEQTHIDYCLIKEPNSLPEIANDFINDYLPFFLPKFDKYLAVVLVNHFAWWLYKVNFTNVKLSLDENLLDEFE